MIYEVEQKICSYFLSEYAVTRIKLIDSNSFSDADKKPTVKHLKLLIYLHNEKSSLDFAPIECSFSKPHANQKLSDEQLVCMNSGDVIVYDGTKVRIKTDVSQYFKAIELTLIASPYH